MHRNGDDNLADHYKKVKSTKKEFPEPEKMEQYEKPIGPERPTATDRIKGAVSSVTGNRFVSGAIGKLKERSAEVAREMRENKAPKKTRRFVEPSYSPMGIQDPSFAFADPFGMAPRNEPQQRAPPRRKRRKRSVSQPRSSPFPQMFGVPRHMRHLF